MILDEFLGKNSLHLQVTYCKNPTSFNDNTVNWDAELICDDNDDDDFDYGSFVVLDYYAGFGVTAKEAVENLINFIQGKTLETLRCNKNIKEEAQPGRSIQVPEELTGYII